MLIVLIGPGLERSKLALPAASAMVFFLGHDLSRFNYKENRHLPNTKPPCAGMGIAITSIVSNVAVVVDGRGHGNY